MIPQLGADPASPFPDADSALQEPDGLLAWGGDLEPARLVNAYRRGIFPWYSEGQPILWWNPSRRCVIFPEKLHLSRRLRRVLRQNRFAISADRAFDDVIVGCALPRRGEDSTWITPAMIRAYSRLHRMGIGHSVEVWQNDELAGGIYGLSLGRVFFGESMFSRISDASKVALAALCTQLRAWQFSLLDCQVSNAHLRRMGASEIGRERYLEILERSLRRNGFRGPWTACFEAATDVIARA
jgi:leucyl/phenylalanyl-tRNA--protein transferase